MFYKSMNFSPFRQCWKGAIFMDLNRRTFLKIIYFPVDEHNSRIVASTVELHNVILNGGVCSLNGILRPEFLVWMNLQVVRNFVFGWENECRNEFTKFESCKTLGITSFDSQQAKCTTKTINLLVRPTINNTWWFQISIDKPRVEKTAGHHYMCVIYFVLNEHKKGFASKWPFKAVRMYKVSGGLYVFGESFYYGQTNVWILNDVKFSLWKRALNSAAIILDLVRKLHSNNHEKPKINVFGDVLHGFDDAIH